MKTINGKKYFVSLGYRDLDETPIDAKKLTSYSLESGNQMIYVDDSDKDNVVAIPLFEVNSIQKKDGVFKFMPMINPRKLHYEEDAVTNKVNTIGLFEVDDSKDHQSIKLVSFFNCNLYFTKFTKITPICIEVNENRI